MSQVYIKGECTISIIPIRSIDFGEYIPKRKYTADNIQYLCDSIKKNGVIEPLVVRRISDRDFELISGVRRLKAAVNAGLSAVPCIVLRCTAQQAVMIFLVDNMQRTSPDIFEQCDSFRYLISKYNKTVEEISLSTGISERRINDIIKLNCFDSFERKLISSGNISDEAAVIIANVSNKKVRRKLLSQIYGKDIERDSLIKLIDKYKLSDIHSDKPKEIIVINDLRPFTNSISKAVELMRRAGKNVVEERTETNSYIEYRIRIQKSDIHTEDI
ncbi:MAG: ParB/RepB/Spo0J family partition protein [Clostridia bacterium]|nr:ParB/RepB/Spo0J family partition protein [Clostridia bacterium]